MIKRLAYILYSLWIFTGAFTQQWDHSREKSFRLNKDTLLVDTLSIIPGTVRVYDRDTALITGSSYRLDYWNARIIPDSLLRNRTGSITVRYNVFPYRLTKPLYRKNYRKVVMGQDPAYSYGREASRSFAPFEDPALISSGNIARGISLGNNQDVIVNSNLNLNLNGAISDNLNIRAVVSDDNIPIQPDGHTQQLQEFDKVYITVFNDRLGLTAGDHQVAMQTGHFLRADKQVKGGSFSINNRLGNQDNIKIRNELSGSISKGYYARKKLGAVEGNQGPYRLTGRNNELNIIVLAGSEKIYLDGKLLKRGQNHDYTIDYNTAEITFTANRPVTKDSRIIAEFEYAAFNYARFMASSKNTMETANGSYFLNYYREQDAKNQTLRQDLPDQHKSLLRKIGDELDRAVVSNADSAGFESDRVRYAKKDTGLTDEPVFVHSTNPDEAVYQVGFSYAGENQGNYRPVKSDANGKVYQWVAPENGIPQGSYEPITLLVAPQKQEMITFGGDRQFANSTSTAFEIGVSNHDKNTFSELGDGDNRGLAFRGRVEQALLQTGNSQLKSRAGYHFLQKQFNPVERFRPVEFARDWNLPDTLFPENEHQLDIGLDYRHKKRGSSHYHFTMLSYPGFYRGMKNGLDNSWQYRGFHLDLDGSYLHSRSPTNQTTFLRHYGTLWKKLSGFTLLLGEETENNRWDDRKSDSLLPGSERYNLHRLGVMYGDSLEDHVFLGYSGRKDFLPEGNTLTKSSRAHDYSAGFQLVNKNGQQLQSAITYRRLQVQDTSLTSQRNENALVGRLSHSAGMLQGGITSSTFYETGAGLEPVREYVYIRVRKGQGVYRWVDYNDNGIKELNEFEVANFNDQGDYIRVYSPTRRYEQVVSNQFNQTLNIRLYRIWGREEGFKKLLSRFSNQFSYRVTRKNIRANVLRDLNPLPYGISDSLILNQHAGIRNTLSFDKTSRDFGVDYVLRFNKNKALLLNGIDTKSRLSHTLKIRQVPVEHVHLFNEAEMAEKTLASEYFKNKNYRLRHYENRFKLEFEPDMKTRTELKYHVSYDKNLEGPGLAKKHEVYTGVNRVLKTRGNLRFETGYMHIFYRGSEHSPVSYDLLEGFKPGNNWQWTIDLKKELIQNLILNLTYEGRKPENTRTIHIGNVQLRALF